MAVRYWLEVPPEEECVRPRGSFRARYNGHCYTCQGTVLRGELARFVRRGGVRLLAHLHCPKR